MTKKERPIIITGAPWSTKYDDKDSYKKAKCKTCRGGVVLVLGLYEKAMKEKREVLCARCAIVDPRFKFKNLEMYDLVEVNPEKDNNNITVRTAAKIIRELI